MTNEEYFQLVDKHWDQLESLIEQFHPGSNNRDVHDYRITAPGAEVACELVRQQNTEFSPLENARKFKEERDGGKLCSLFNTVWFGMPESSDVRSIPGFFVLCDLCSEWEGDNYEE